MIVQIQLNFTRHVKEKRGDRKPWMALIDFPYVNDLMELQTTLNLVPLTNYKVSYLAEEIGCLLFH